VIETELLVAEAGLGEHARARAGLERLFEQHRAQRGPLTIAELCEAGLRIALLSGDHAVARTHCAEMVSRYEATGISTLIQHAQELRTETQVQLGEQPVHSLRRSLGTPGMQMHTFENSAFSVDGASLSDLAQRGLRLMLADQSAEQGFLYWVRDEVCTAAAALAPEPIDARVEAWVRARVREESVDVPTVVLSEKSALPATTRDVLTLGTRVFRLTMLYDAGDGRHGVVGVAVAAADGGAPVRFVLLTVTEAFRCVR
jgi:hypothetical protein